LAAARAQAGLAAARRLPGCATKPIYAAVTAPVTRARLPSDESMKRYADLLADALLRVRELQPWDLSRQLARERPPLVLDVREPAEFALARIPGSINVPRGVLEQACEWDYDETLPLLAGGRERPVVVVCRSGNRSVLAADVMQQMGFADVASLKTGVRGWNDYEQPLLDAAGNAVDGDEAERLLAPRLRPEQRRPR
jgi:rhodanese-related sulfurtransferase